MHLTILRELIFLWQRIFFTAFGGICYGLTHLVFCKPTLLFKPIQTWVLFWREWLHHITFSSYGFSAGASHFEPRNFETHLSLLLIWNRYRMISDNRERSFGSPLDAVCRYKFFFPHFPSWHSHCREIKNKDKLH